MKIVKKAKTKFEVGDLVRVKSYGDIKKTLDSYFQDKKTNLPFSNDMIKYCDNSYNIAAIINMENNTFYTLRHEINWLFHLIGLRGFRL